MAHSHNFRITTIRLVWSHLKSVQPSDFSSTIFSGTKVTCLVQCDHFAPVWCDVMTLHQQSAKTLKEGYFCTITHVKLMFVQPFHPRLLWHYWIVTALCVIVTSHQTRAIPPAWSKNVCWGKKNTWCACFTPASIPGPANPVCNSLLFCFGEPLCFCRGFQHRRQPCGFVAPFAHVAL